VGVCGGGLAPAGKELATYEASVAEKVSEVAVAGRRNGVKEKEKRGNGGVQSKCTITVVVRWGAYTLSLTLLTLHSFSKSKSKMWRLMLSM
jgi:hypothetical protein